MSETSLHSFTHSFYPPSTGFRVQHCEVQVHGLCLMALAVLCLEVRVLAVAGQSAPSCPVIKPHGPRERSRRVACLTSIPPRILSGFLSPTLQKWKLRL